LLLAAAASSAQTKPSNADDVLRVETDLVTVPISVTDRQGRFIPDLDQSKFHLYEDGVEQKIAFFENASQPFTIALLLDTSDSARFKLEDIQQAALAFVDQLRPGDRLIVAAFDHRVNLLTEATGDRVYLREAILKVQGSGSTALYNAFSLVVNERLKSIRGRKAIVMFTDGVDTASAGATFENTLHRAEELDAMIYSIQYNTMGDVIRDATADHGGEVYTGKGEPLGAAYARAHRYLRLMADKSGGRFYYADTVARLRETFARIAAELRQQYSIGYYPPPDERRRERKIKVKVEVPDSAVRARRSYILRQRSFAIPTANNYRLSARAK
jgi:Ca-activated chloride channel family protein